MTMKASDEISPVLRNTLNLFPKDESIKLKDLYAKHKEIYPEVILSISGLVRRLITLRKKKYIYKVFQGVYRKITDYKSKRLKHLNK